MVTLDADGQHKPEDLPRIVAALDDGADLVRRRARAHRPHAAASPLRQRALGRLPDLARGHAAARRAVGLPRAPRAVLDALGLSGVTRARPGGARAGVPLGRLRLRDRDPGRRRAPAGSRSRTCRSRPSTRGAPSHIHPLREMPRFASLYARLLADAGRWSARRAAAGSGDAREHPDHQRRRHPRAGALRRCARSCAPSAACSSSRPTATRARPATRSRSTGRFASSAPSPTSTRSTARRPTASSSPRTACSTSARTIVISGINHGPNMGEDVFYSGTVAAAIEGALQGTAVHRGRRSSPVGADRLPVGLRCASRAAGRRRARARAAAQERCCNVNLPVRPEGTPIEACGSRSSASASTRSARSRKIDPRGRRTTGSAATSRCGKKRRGPISSP